MSATPSGPKTHQLAQTMRSKRTTSDSETEFPEAMFDVLNNFYVDGNLDAYTTAEEVT